MEITTTAPHPAVASVAEAAGRIREWGEARDWRGWDPYDALNSPLAPVLTLGTPFGRRVLIQAVKRSSLNLRPLLRIAPAWNAKAIGLVASAYVHLAAAGDASARQEAARWLDWLDAARCGAGRHDGWGYHFDVQTRFFFYPRNSPNTIATAFVAGAFLDAYELLGEEARLETAVAAADLLVAEMLVRDGERRFFRYVPADTKLIHNANLLACAVLARAAGPSGRSDLAELVGSALRATLDAQRPDGSWPYSDWQGNAWVDNFHTGYVLEALAACVDLAPDAGERLDRGLAFWERELFLPDGTPKYFPDRVEPLDAHCYAQAIETWVAVAGRHAGAVAQAERVAHLLIESLLEPGGYVAFQRRGRRTNRVPFVRWTTAPSFRALARLLLQRRSVETEHARLD